MKTYITFLIAFTISISTFAQQGINYKAVIKDDLGNVIAGQEIDVKFSIIEDAGATVVYAEEHLNKMTDANGIIILNIGEGTPITNTFASIAWGSDTHSLKTEIDLDNDTNYEDMGTTPFKTVPYAITAANVTGMKQHTWNGNTGWNLIGAFQTGFIGENAIDLSQTSSVFVGARGTSSFAVGISTNALGDNSTAMGFQTDATGVLSTAMGSNTEASGLNSTAMGFSTVASGINSTAMGSGTNAIGDESTAMGYQTEATGELSTAMGYRAIASGSNSTAMGRNTLASGLRSTAMGYETIASAAYATALGYYNIADPNALLILGNGTSSQRNNALVVKTNGDTQFDGEIQHTSTGDANMIPIAYGSVDSFGAIIGGTGNFTVTYNAGTTSYTIFVNNTPITAANSAGVVSVNTSTFRTANTTYDGNNMLVHIFISNGDKVQSPFQFVIYQE